MRPPNIPAVVIVLLTYAVGCNSQPRPASDAPASAPAQPAAASSPQAAPPAPVAPQPAAAASSSLASSEGEQPGLRIEVQELKRTAGGTLTLKVAFVNTATKPIGLDFGDKQIDFANMASLGGVNLVDAAGKKKYFVVRDSENRCLCSGDLASLQPGARANVWAKFPAPPDEVQKITLMIPHFPPLEEIPIGQ